MAKRRLWEFKKVEVGDIDDKYRTVDRYEADGWVTVALEPHRVVFKRKA